MSTSGLTRYQSDPERGALVLLAQLAPDHLPEEVAVRHAAIIAVGATWGRDGRRRRMSARAERPAALDR